jgi:hypothetical protein
MQGINLSKTVDIVTNFFAKKATQIDKEVKFVKRKSKLNAQLFSEVLIMGCLSDPAISLERICRMLKERGVKITKQGLHQRFNQEATGLMKNLCTQSLKQFSTKNENVLRLLEPFSTVKMQDSTGMSLSDNLKNIFKGHGGSGSEAGIKIQTLYDYVQGQIDKITVTQGTRNDQGFDDHLDKVKEGGLLLQDLGYFKVKSFEKIAAKRAYFISRYSYPTAIFDEHGKRMDLLKVLAKLDSVFSKDVSLGKKEKLAVRLIALPLPAEEVEKRLKKLRKKAQKSGRGLTRETIELAKWSLYITNVPEKWLNAEQVHLVYSVRWQIELLFKVFKSEAGLAKVSGKKPDRILCELYAKLICVVILLYLSFPIRWQDTQELSFYKAYKVLKLKASDFFKSLHSRYKLMKFIKGFMNDLIEFALKDKHRKKRRLTYQKVMDTVGQEILV